MKSKQEMHSELSNIQTGIPRCSELVVFGCTRLCLYNINLGKLLQSKLYINMSISFAKSLCTLYRCIDPVWSIVRQPETNRALNKLTCFCIITKVARIKITYKINYIIFYSNFADIKGLKGQHLFHLNFVILSLPKHEVED